ncbi:hypothetical protein, partial [Klebsiella pneumoniae]|uniref:hypothetical protein n=1 Tax=Klebsiella pneumoniae TaxID=573 RepID=UPI003853ABB8
DAGTVIIALGNIIPDHHVGVGFLIEFQHVFECAARRTSAALWRPAGDKAQLLAAINALKEHNIAVLLDVVVNHKMGADE